MIAPPLLVSYSNLDQYLTSLPLLHQEKYQEKITSFVEHNLPPVVSPSALGVLFGYSTDFIHALSAGSHKYYRTFNIRKGKKSREIKAPKVALKVIQKWFSEHLSQSIEFPDHVFGFIPGKSAAQAAQQHCNSKWIYSVDIENFFPSTHKSFVIDSLQELGYSETASDLIASICCFGESLAQGSPASPVLSNLVMKNIDHELAQIAKSHGIEVTRYADDIVFSGKEDFPQKLPESIKSIFEQGCWKLNSDKEFFADVSKGQRLKVHGLLVMGSHIRLTKGYRNKIRAYKHMIEQGKVSEKDMPRILGHIHYANSIEK
jgi:RNA-directed DNA polymerase